MSINALLRLLPFFVIFAGLMALRISGGRWTSPGGGSVVSGVIGSIIGNILLAAFALILYAGYVRRERTRLIGRLVTAEGANTHDAICKMCGYALDGLARTSDNGKLSATCPECGHVNKLRTA